MDEEKYIRGLSDDALSRMINIDANMYTKPEMDIAIDEMNRREQLKHTAEPVKPEVGEPAEPKAAEPKAVEHKPFYEHFAPQTYPSEADDGEGSGEPLPADKEERAKHELDTTFVEMNSMAQDGEAEESAGPQQDKAELWGGKTVKCPDCGRELPEFAKYCLECGYKFTDEGGRKIEKRLIGIVIAFAIYLFIIVTKTCN